MLKYHDIQHDTMLQGEGLRVAVFFSGCDLYPKCKGCHNSIAWDKDSGILFDDFAKNEIFEQLSQEYISGLTLLGGEPLASFNVEDVTKFAKEIKLKFPHKTIWCYTGKLWEDVKHLEIMQYIDVLLDGQFVEELADINIPFVGSSNQTLVDVQVSLQKGYKILYKLR